MFNIFKSKKTKQLEQLKEQFMLGNMNNKEYKARVYEISPDEWYKISTPEDKELRELNKKLNTNMISKEEYKSKIKHLDIETYIKILDDTERYVYDLETKHENGKISDEEYDKEIKTLNGEPYIAIKKVEFDKETSQYMFEFDWNQHFIDELKDNGFDGDTDEAIMDEWFTTFCTMVAADSEKVIVTDPDDIRKVTKRKNATDHY